MSEERVNRAARTLEGIERMTDEFHRFQILTRDERDLVLSVAREHFERVRKGENAEEALNKLQAMRGLLETAFDTEGVESSFIQIPTSLRPVPQHRVEMGKERYSDVLALLRVLIPSAKKAEKTTIDLYGSRVINPIVVVPGRPPLGRIRMIFRTHPQLGVFSRTIYDVSRFPPEDREKEAARILAELALRYHVPYAMSEQQLNRGPFLELYTRARLLADAAERLREIAEKGENVYGRRFLEEASFNASRAHLEEHIRSLLEAARTYHRLLRRPETRISADSILESVARLLVNDAKLLAKEENIGEEEALERLIETTRSQARSFTRNRLAIGHETTARPIRDLVHLHEFLRGVEERARDILRALREEENEQR